MRQGCGEMMRGFAVKLIGISFIVFTADIVLPDKNVYRGVKTLLYLLETAVLIEPLIDFLS